MRVKVLGAVLGGAVGDALGAPFEGLWSHSIPSREQLLAEYGEYEGYPRGQYTDDTQLTIATLRSIVHSGHINPADIARAIFQLFRNQAVIGPGGACSLAATQFFDHGDWQRCGAPIGDAGNGAAMRTTALGLYFVNNPNNLSQVVADISSITHKDPRSIAGGVIVAKAAQLLVCQPAIDAGELCRELAIISESIHQPFSNYLLQLPEYLTQDDNQARNFIAWAGMRYAEFDQPIITPFVIPTVLAAIWSVLKYPHSWPEAVAYAIGLGGDVDTLGAIVGGLMGAKLGMDAIPQHLINTVVDTQRLRQLAERYALVIEKVAR